MQDNTQTTKQKAVHINIVDNVYGSIAEIGGGQEVARAFFQAGGASGTVAKSISAYDKTFSDYYYNSNKPGRYVAEDRVIKMLHKEYTDLLNVISESKDCETKFFSFADTVETLNYHKNNKPHGWMGIRFQGSDRSKPNEVKLHFNLLENDGNLQQYTLGALGVNLIYACFHHHTTPNTFLISLMDNLDTDRIEIDLVSMEGPDLDYVDNRLLGVQMVKNGMTHAVMFDKDGNLNRPGDMLYKKDIVAIRGSFRPITYVGFDMIKTAIRMIKREGDYNKEKSIVLCEITMRNLMASGELDERDFLARVDILNGMNQNVMISNYSYFYRLSEYFNQFSINKLRLVIGIPTLENLVQDKYYSDLGGGVLEAFGRLFNKNVKLYVYPLIKNKRLKTGRLLNVDENIFYLYQHLLNNDKIVDMEDMNRAWQGIFARDVLNMIKTGEAGWEEKTPRFVSNYIIKNGLFGYKKPKEL
ncbi:MAG: nicotinate-nucleotide adenylyltransferase [Bacteroidetes bacterium 4572_112]|nr:MAG: nicotinate-nucleotide adenylyltransferase [Bacteroidetes bacterium 4572_112]